MGKTRRVVITGGPGTGKTTILSLLEEKGFPTHREISREVIKQEMDRGSELLPWRDLPGFSDRVFQGQMTQYRQALEGQVNFYDRGIIDVIAYLKKDLLPHEALEDLIEHYPYCPKVFLTPPWTEIYEQDSERREDLETMNAIHNSLMKTYSSYGYEVLEVPKKDASGRVEFVLEQLELL